VKRGDKKEHIVCNLSATCSPRESIDCRALALATNFFLWLQLCVRLHAGEVQLPSVALAGVPFEIAASGFAPQTRVQLRFEDARGIPLAQADAVADESGAASLQHPPAPSGHSALCVAGG
jgi:hypothetical protein